MENSPLFLAPFEVNKVWSDWKVFLVNYFFENVYSGKITLVNNLLTCADWDQELASSFKNTFNYVPSKAEIRQVLSDVIELDFLQVSEYRCTCCSKTKLQPSEVLDHAVRLQPRLFSKLTFKVKCLAKPQDGVVCESAD